MSVRTRFAPSPTGLLHLGHARAAFEAFGFADQHGGTCLLRIEDIDHTRCLPSYTQAIYRDLDWLRLDWPLPVRVQNKHYKDYIDVIIRLIEMGLAYPSTLSRAELKAGKRAGPETPLSFSDFECEKWSEYSLTSFKLPLSEYPKTKNLILSCLESQKIAEKPNLPFAIRLDLKVALSKVSEQSLTHQYMNQADALKTGEILETDARTSLVKWVKSDRPDPIIARRDISVSYDIAVTHDDALQHITHIVRGQDLEDQTPLHILIQLLMGWPQPIYYHHDLVLRADGEKLAKRNLDTSLEHLRSHGQSLKEIKHLSAYTL